MTQKKAVPPPNQRSFGNAWGELDYVCKKINFWLYTQQRRARAGRYLKRLAEILVRLPDNDLAIIRAEGHALRCELQRNFGEAIEHRK